MNEYSKTRFERRDGRNWIRVIDQLPARHRYLHFGTSIQGVLDLDNMAKPVLEYIGLMAALAKKSVEEPVSILVGGLGACAIWHAMLAWRGPRCRIEVVESSDLVLELAEHYFRFKPQSVVAAQSLREMLALSSGESFELVFVDCYNARFMPAELLSVEFMQILKKRIAPEGVAIANLWNPKCNKICGHQIRTMLEVFGHVGLIAGKEDDNFAICLPNQYSAKLARGIILKGRQYPVTWIDLERPRNWPDYLLATRPIYDGNVWQFMRQLRELPTA